MCRDQAARWSAADALDHPWLRRLRRPRAAVEPGTTAATNGDAVEGPRRSSSSDAPTGVVQRIQRYGKFNQFKRSALESIAGRCMRQTREYSQSLDGAGRSASVSDAGGEAAAAGVQPDDTQKLVVARPAPAPAAAAQPPRGSAALTAGATIGAEKIRAKVKGGTSLRRAKGLLEHMMVTGGTVRACRGASLFP